MNYDSFILTSKVWLSNISRKIRPVRGHNNILTNKAACYKLRYNISGINNKIILESGGKLVNVLIYIRGNQNSITIESKCLVKNTVIYIENDNSALKIGKGTTIEGAHFGIAENNKKIILGQDCMLSENIYLTTTDSHSILNDTNERFNQAANVNIGNHVWIGRNSTILKGSDICDNSIIGASSVVTGNVKANSIYTGVPARLVKQNITWLREKV